MTAASDYAETYDRIISAQDNYNQAEHSPGFRTCARHTERLRMCTGPSLDVGCGVGFAVQYLEEMMPWDDTYGCDVSPVAVERARARCSDDRIGLIEDGRIPYDDGAFGLVTSFDVVEHLDEHDLPMFRDELRRVARPGGLLLVTASLREALAIDHLGRNAHRTVRPIQWWLDLFDPDDAAIDCRRCETLLWIRIR